MLTQPAALAVAWPLRTPRQLEGTAAAGSPLPCPRIIASALLLLLPLLTLMVMVLMRAIAWACALAAFLAPAPVAVALRELLRRMQLLHQRQLPHTPLLLWLALLPPPLAARQDSAALSRAQWLAATHRWHGASRLLP